MAVSAWPLRRKVALALAIPLLLAGTLGGLRVQSDLVEASNSASSAQQVTALRPAVDYLTAAEQAMVVAVGDDEASQTALEEALADIRKAGLELLESKAFAELTDAQRYQVDAVLDLSQTMRAEDASTLSPGTWVEQLRQLQSGVTQLITTIVNEQINPEPRLELLAQTLAGRFSLAMQQALVATERSGETGSLELFSELGVEGAAIDRLAGALGTNEKAVASLRTANAQRFRTVRTGGTDLGGTEAYADYDRIISTLQRGIDDELEAAAAEARTDAVVNAVVTVAALVAAILLALLISRLLLNPIRRVREDALAVAHKRLPEAVARIRAGEDPGEITPVEVTTEEEIGQLARAVDDMHRQAVVLASGEANLRSQVSRMFVTLSRRNTSLINQQLGLIERLERDEEDPKRLDSLFRLDHLAARMRRTADSLLILADAPTATAVVEGLTVRDALQAATSGVQDYQRVRIRSTNSMRISDSAAADVVHLITELVDNALAYSPPGSTVTVGSTVTPEGVLVEIGDAGLGIPAEQLAKINESLRSGGEVTPDTARRMGLFVVSRLSQRHGVSTALRANGEGGTTATVMLPVAILPELAPPSAPEPRDAAPEPDVPKAAPGPDVPKAAPGPDVPKAAPGPDAPKVADTPSLEKVDRKRQKADRKSQKADRQPEPVEAMSDNPAAMDVGARIDAALGLPTRTPGAIVSPTSAPVDGPPGRTAATAKGSPAEEPTSRPTTRQTDLPTRQRAAAAEPAESAQQRAVVPVPVEAPTPVGVRKPEAVPDPDPVAVRDPGPEAAHYREPEAVREPAPPQPERSPVGDSDPERAAEPEPAPGAETPPTAAFAAVSESAPARATGTGALDGEWIDTGDDGFDTPIFRSLRSAWLSPGEDAQPWRTSEIEAGWEMADQVAETEVAPEVSQSGLPVRRPGTRLVPGGVTATHTATVRDPEAIRARLAAHASGVSRGRAATPDPS